MSKLRREYLTRWQMVVKKDETNSPYNLPVIPDQVWFFGVGFWGRENAYKNKVPKEAEQRNQFWNSHQKKGFWELSLEVKDYENNY